MTPTTGSHAAAQPGERGGAAERGPVDYVVDKLNAMAGGTDHVELRFSNFVDAVFRRHYRGESDVLFACGSPGTTPSLANVSRAWPHPWLYSRVFLVLLVATFGLWLLSSFFQNPIGYPGLMFMGALLVPFTAVVFFFETNVPRNLGFARVIEIFFVGGVLSLLCIYPLAEVFPESGTGDLFPSMMTGVIEELAKVVGIVVFVKMLSGRNYVLTGMLIGAAVGAGFAVFETAGYIFNSFLYVHDATIVDYVLSSGQQGVAILSQMFQQGSPAFITSEDLSFMMDTMVLRALTALGGHVAWASVEGGALALAARGGSFEMSHLTSGVFVPFLAISVVLHGIWDALVPVLDDVVVLASVGITLKLVLEVVAIWVVIFVLLHRGVAQMNQLAEEARAQTSDGAPTGARAAAGPDGPGR